MILLIFSGHVAIKLYADDTKLYSSIRCPVDSALLQSGVNFLIDLSLAVNKCSVLHVGTHAISHYLLVVSSLPICNIISDLGVEIDNFLSLSLSLSLKLICTI